MNTKKIFTSPRKLLLECAVAGIQYHDIEELWDELYEGFPLRLIREHNNVHDHNAVAVALAVDPDTCDEEEEYIIGYIPRSKNSVIAALLDTGWADKLEAKIVRLKEEASYSDRIHIALYVRNAQTDADKNYVRLVAMDDDKWPALTNQLWSKGYARLTWNVEPASAHGLPVTGDRVAAIKRDGRYAHIYLLMIVATDDECHNYTCHGEMPPMGNCRPFVLTAIAGPVKVAAEHLHFLSNLLDTCDRPDYCLSPDDTRTLLSLIGL